jgi:hypothetical protein
MTPIKRPLAVTILACVYLLTGAVGFVGHFRESVAAPREGVLIELLELLALLSGAFLLRGRNWARWLALAWIAFHVILSFWDPVQRLVAHCVFLILIAWILFHPSAARYFRGSNPAIAR